MPDFASPASALQAGDLDLLSLRGSMLIFEAADHYAAHEAARQAALHALGTGSPDLVLAEPARDRWTAPEVEDLVLAPGRRTAEKRLVIVLARADCMDSSAADRMLKQLEDNPGDALHLFAVSDAGELRPALRGRAAGVIRVSATSAEQVRGELTLAGYTSDEAVVLQQVLEPSPRLRHVMTTAGAEAGRPLGDMLTQGPGAPSPFAAAALQMQSMEQVLRTAGVNKTAMKAEQRILLREVARCWLAGGVRALVESPESVRTQERTARALASAVSSCASHANPQAVLALLHARCA